MSRSTRKRTRLRARDRSRACAGKTKENRSRANSGRCRPKQAAAKSNPRPKPKPACSSRAPKPASPAARSARRNSPRTLPKKARRCLRPAVSPSIPSTSEVLITGWIGSEEHLKPQVWAVSDKGEIKTVWEDKTEVTGRMRMLDRARRDIGREDSRPRRTTSTKSPNFPRTCPRKRRRNRPSGCLARRECEERLSNKESPCPFIEKIASDR